MDNDVAVKVGSVSKTFKLPHEKQTSVKGALINFKKRGYEKQQVLTGINFEVKKGEFFGIVGRNGSGKSTLLKLLAGIYTPDKGDIRVNGRLTPFIELGVGFNPELSGRENVFLNGALLGFGRKEMEAMYDDIVKFAEIERFMDQKLKNYSSGMQVRLAFSIAIRAKGDILLLDEVLAVGDAAFQQKCYDYFEQLKRDKRTVIFVSHDMTAVRRFCTRALLLSKGEIELIGDTGVISDRYIEENFEDESSKQETSKTGITPYEFRNALTTATDSSAPRTSFDTKEEIQLKFTAHSSGNTEYHIGLQLFNDSGAYCFGTNTKIRKTAPLTGQEKKVKFILKPVLAPGTYFVTLAVMNKAATKVLYYQPRVVTFNVKRDTLVEGIALMDHYWEVKHV